MPTKEETLRNETHKNDVEEVGSRVFYTLTDVKSREGHRVATCISKLVEILHEKKILDDEAIDELLFKCVQ